MSNSAMSKEPKLKKQAEPASYPASMHAKNTSLNTSQPFAKVSNIRVFVAIAVFSAISYVLMLLDFPLPIAPAFIKLDFSDLPALILAFAFGPLSGILVELVKNLLHLFTTQTAGIGELSNFILGASLVGTAGLVYKFSKTLKGALLGITAGTLAFVITGIISNYFIMFPFYTTVMHIPMESIIAMCAKINPFIDSELKVILLSVTPFNLLKGALISLITLLSYKKLTPILKVGLK